MKRIIPVIGLLALLCGILGPTFVADVAPAFAADPQYRTQAASGPALPFPRSERAQSVWASGACWSACGAYCAWGQTGCLERDAQGLCLRLTDTCDRYCQRNCRTSGGPLLPIDF